MPFGKLRHLFVNPKLRGTGDELYMSRKTRGLPRFPLEKISNFDPERVQTRGVSEV